MNFDLRGLAGAGIINDHSAIGVRTLARAGQDQSPIARHLFHGHRMHP
jgi:hypothetical protein